ncbi:MAG: hypothetical protein JZD41_02115 [Thermoproteus sp.]|nr:hypothetical protein [Thermoproteus sp.]
MDGYVNIGKIEMGYLTAHLWLLKHKASWYAYVKFSGASIKKKTLYLGKIGELGDLKWLVESIKTIVNKRSIAKSLARMIKVRIMSVIPILNFVRGSLHMASVMSWLAKTPAVFAVHAVFYRGVLWYNIDMRFPEKVDRGSFEKMAQQLRKHGAYFDKKDRIWRLPWAGVVGDSLMALGYTQEDLANKYDEYYRAKTEEEIVRVIQEWESKYYAILNDIYNNAKAGGGDEVETLSLSSMYEVDTETGIIPRSPILYSIYQTDMRPWRGKRIFDREGIPWPVKLIGDKPRMIGDGSLKGLEEDG